jgi:hypothetical protein
VNALDAAWHLLNFLAPPACLGALSAAAAKLFWARELRGRSWFHLMCWAAVPAAVVALAALVITGRDGRMSTYGAMVVAAAVGLWTRIPGRGG